MDFQTWQNLDKEVLPLTILDKNWFARTQIKSTLIMDQKLLRDEKSVGVAGHDQNNFKFDWEDPKLMESGTKMMISIWLGFEKLSDGQIRLVLSEHYQKCAIQFDGEEIWMVQIHPELLERSPK